MYAELTDCMILVFRLTLQSSNVFISEVVNTLNWVQFYIGCYYMNIYYMLDFHYRGNKFYSIQIVIYKIIGDWLEYI